jgi:hypothetical protein
MTSSAHWFTWFRAAVSLGAIRPKGKDSNGLPLPLTHLGPVNIH